jgi:hypothetical protein
MTCSRPAIPHVMCPAIMLPSICTSIFTSSKINLLTLYLIDFLECGCGKPIFSTYLFSHVFYPVILHSTKKPSYFHNLHNDYFPYLDNYLIVNAGVIPFSLFLLSMSCVPYLQSRAHHNALYIPLFAPPYLTIVHIPRHHITITQFYLFPMPHQPPLV